jgi:hypothetical protein
MISTGVIGHRSHSHADQRQAVVTGHYLLFPVEQLPEVTSPVKDANDHKFFLFHTVGNDVVSDHPKKVTFIRHIRACVTHAWKLCKQLYSPMNLLVQTVSSVRVIFRDAVANALDIGVRSAGNAVFHCGVVRR